MAQLGWVDPANGNETLFADALAIAEGAGSWAGVPYEVLRGMFENLHGERPDGASVTQLLGCPRRVHLEKLVDYHGEVMESYAMFRGTLGHTLLEQFAPAGSKIEERYFRLFRDIELSGAVDSWRILGVENGPSLTQDWHDWLWRMWELESGGGPCVDCAHFAADKRPAYRNRKCQKHEQPKLPKGARFLIRDWKSRHDLPMGTYMPVKHQKQGNLYRWTLRIPVELADVEFVYFSMQGVKVIPLYDGGTFRNGRNKPEQLMSDSAIEDFLMERLIPLALQSKLDRPLPYDRVTEEDLWNCKYCPAIRLCHKLAAEEARASWARGETYDRLPPRGGK